MGYNRRNILKRIVEIQNITLSHTKRGVTQKWGYENIIYPRFFLSPATYYNYLAVNAKAELKKLDEAEAAQLKIEFKSKIMNTLKTTFLVHDQFCGARGSSLGIRNLSQKYGGGIEVSMALNHWCLAVETHSANFPEIAHDCTDISATDSHRYPGADMLITSPK